MSDIPLLLHAETESEGEGSEFDPRPDFLLNHSDDEGKPREDLWRQGIQDLEHMPIALGHEWIPIGPAPLTSSARLLHGNGPGPFSGEVTDIAIDPRGANDEVIYVATNDGGIWKTSDGGSTWLPLTDDLPSLSMGAVALDPANPDIVYAGSGNPNDGGNEFSRGAGLYKSMDGGLTWAVLDGGPFSTVLAGLHINRILVLPGDILLVATGGGLFRSEDGGLNFGANAPGFNDGHPLADIGEAKITTLVCDDNTVTPTTIYAAASGKGIFVSADNGRTFPDNSNLFGTSHPGAPAVFSDIAFAQTVPHLNKRLFYASVQYDTPKGGDPRIDPQRYVGLFVSANEGQNWVPRPDAATKANFDMVAGGADQTNYDLTIGVDPQAPERVYIGFQQLWMSLDKGQNFGLPPSPVTSDIMGDDLVHWDHHALAFRPASHWPGTAAPPIPTRFYVGTDGGLSRIEVSPVGKISWTQLNGTIGGAIATNLMFDIDIGRGSAANNRFTYGGTQDLGLEVHGPTNDLDWEMVMSGDGIAIAVDPADPEIAYGFSPPAFVLGNHGRWDFSTRPGATIGRGLPRLPALHTLCIALKLQGADPVHRVIYAGVLSQVWKSIDGGLNFSRLANFDPKQQLRTLTTTSLDSNRVWAGMADGSVHMSADGGTTWDAGSFQTNTGGGGPVTGIAVDPADINRVVVVHAGFTNINPTFVTRHAFLTPDNGQTWRDISGTSGLPNTNLPDLPLHDVVLDGSTNPPTIIVGSDAAVLCSRDLGATWQVLGIGLPRVLCRSLALDSSAAPPLLRLGTYGRSCFELKKISGQRLEVRANLAFDAVPVGGQATLPVEVLSAGDADLQITDFHRTGGNTDFTITSAPVPPLTLHPGEKHTFTVQFQPSAAGPAKKTGFEITSDDPGNTNYLLIATGRGLAEAGTPRLAVHTNLGFGQVNKGSGARTLTARLSNTGTADLKVNSITRASGSSAFDLSPAPVLPATLHPGEHLDVTFRFDPGGNDEHQATFETATTDPRSPAIIDLHGSGSGFTSFWLTIGLVALGVGAGVVGTLLYEKLTKK